MIFCMSPATPETELSNLSLKVSEELSLRVGNIRGFGNLATLGVAEFFYHRF